jgi:hypothetical protein
MNQTHNSCPPDAFHNLVAAEGTQLFRDNRGRAMDIILKLRVLMEITAPGSHLAFECEDAGVDLHEKPQWSELAPFFRSTLPHFLHLAKGRKRRKPMSFGHSPASSRHSRYAA